MAASDRSAPLGRNVDDVDDSREVSDLRLDSAVISSTRGPRPLP